MAPFVAGSEAKVKHKIEWESKEKDLTHLNYVEVNGTWYLVAGFVGLLEVYSEDGQKIYT